MGDILISLNTEEEQLVRKLAYEKYQGKKGAISQIVKDGLKKLEEDEQTQAGKTLIELMRKADYKIPMYKNRSELYD